MDVKQPNNTALRTALWRMLHILTDDKPYVIEDQVGYDLIQPENGWEERPDMKYTKRLRASVVARARFVEDLAKEQIAKGINQYILLGAGLDSFAQRNAPLLSQIEVYEIDQPDTLIWKSEKLVENGYPIPKNLHFVPVDFETTTWWTELLKSGFQIHQPAFVSCTGVTLYLTKEANADLLKQLYALAQGSTIAIAFYLPLHLLDAQDQPMQEMAIKGAAAAGTPFLSFFSEGEITTLAQEIGWKDIRIVSTLEMTNTYFKDRKDDLVPASGEFFLIATN